MDGGAEILNVKTILDTLNARVALFAVGETLEMTNAGFPYAMGGYDDTPEDMARHNEVLVNNGWVNLIGGCWETSEPPWTSRRNKGRTVPMSST